MDQYFSHINCIIKKGEVSHRIRFLLQDLVELRMVSIFTLIFKKKIIRSEVEGLSVLKEKSAFLAEILDFFVK